MNSENTKSPRRPLLTISGILGGVVGYYCGLMILFPLAGALLAWGIARLFMPAASKPFAPAFALISGHMIWMLIGTVVAQASLLVLAPDLVCIIAGLIWLALRPGKGAVILLIVYEGLSLLSNIIMISKFEFGTAGHKALAAHIALRVAAVTALITGYRLFKKKQTEQGADIPTPVA